MTDNDDRNHNHIPGFPGDGDADIELHHVAPATWTRKMTAWSVVILAVSIVIVVTALYLTADII